MSFPRPNLEEVTRKAVEESRQALAATQAKARTLVREMNIVAERLGSPSADTASGRFVGVVRERRLEIERLFAQQASVADSFNIVLFGRTGAGKSTLIEALTRGSGRLVSHGESDWTTDVEPKMWESCKVYDTPGVNGWGRNNTRSDLEKRARHAVEVADFVLVCFDSQSQQASEFTKVAEWVHQFNKPVIAVLNARNAVWRLPPRVPVGAARANASRAVAQHAANIQDELAGVGLAGVPVVAIASKRALFARASLPFEGPDRETLELHRASYGIDKLDAWSNFPALEGLLARCIEDSAVALRMGALYDQLRGVLDVLAEGMDTGGKETAEEAAVIEVQTVEPLLKLLGYPTSISLRQPYFHDGSDRLQVLEDLRGRFQAPSAGGFSVFVHQRLTAELGALRSRSLVDAEEAVAYAFDSGRTITGEELRKKCFRTSEMEAAAKKVLDEAHEFISRHTRLAYRDSVADLKARLRDTADVEGDAGLSWKYGAWGLKTAGVLGGAAAALGGLALANFWNPLGWASGAAAGVATIGTFVAGLFGWLGDRARTRAEARKLQARRAALANVRKNVHEVYDGFAESTTKAASDIAVGAAAQVVLPAVEQALDLRQLSLACGMIASLARSMIDKLPSKADPQRLVCEAKTLCERDAEPGRPDAGPRHWLGELWIDDPEGLERQFQGGGQRRTGAYDPRFLDSLFAGIREIWSQVTSSVQEGSGHSWLVLADRALADDELARPALDELRAIAARARPRLHLVGDYNAGKSSFIKRLLLDAGEVSPTDLRIRANPTTDREHHYAWGNIDLIDTPGFQSSKDHHTEAARRSFPDASAILYLFQPNLVTGDDSLVRLVLKGDQEQGIVPKAPRTFFIVNRADEFGVDPVDNIRRYKDLAERKQRELSQALASRAISVRPARILCMASDPFGLVGDRIDATSASYDAHRSWDGFDHFMSSFREIEGELMRVGVDRSLLEGGLARLARLDARRASESERLVAQSDAIGRMHALVAEQKAEGQRLAAEHHARLVRRVEEHAASMKDDVLSEQDPTRLKLKAASFLKWWEDPALAVELEQWGTDTKNELEAWRVRTAEAINRRLEAAEFRYTFPDPTVPDGPGAPGDTRARSRVRDTFEKAGRMVGAATRDVVYDIGKTLGFKFKPWGGVKLAKSLGKAGVVIAAIGVTWDIADIFLEERRQAEREQARKDLASWLANVVPVVVKTVAEGNQSDPGLIRAAGDYIGQLDGYVADLLAKQDVTMQAISAAGARRTTYASLRIKAEQSLGSHIWEGA